MYAPILLLVLLLAIAIAVAAYVVLPLLRGPRGALPGPAGDSVPDAAGDGPTETATRVAVLRDRRRELDAALAHLPADAPERREAMNELAAQAALELGASSDPLPPAAAAPRPERGRPLFAGLIAAALVVPAFLLYLLVGEPQAVSPELQALRGGMPSLEQMADGLRQRLAREPERTEGWQLLGRTELALGRIAAAREAFERAAALAPEDAGVKVDLADAIAQQQGANLDGRPIELIREALAIDPRHQKGLALAGAWHVTQQDFPAAIRNWQALLDQLPPGSPQADQIRGFVTDLQAGRPPRYTQAGTDAAPGAPDGPGAQATGPGPRPAPSAGAGGAAPAAVRGTVELAAALVGRAQPGDTVYIVARALDASGAPAGPPVAVLTARVADLPFEFSLDDSMSMMPSARISSAQRVAVVARVSRSGDATPRPGDLQGTSVPVAPGASGVQVQIDSVVQ